MMFSNQQLLFIAAGGLLFVNEVRAAVGSAVNGVRNSDIALASQAGPLNTDADSRRQALDALAAKMVADGRAPDLTQYIQ